VTGERHHGVGASYREGERLALLDELQGDRRNERRLVDGSDGDFDIARKGLLSVAPGKAHAPPSGGAGIPILAREMIGRPGERRLLPVGRGSEDHPARQALGPPVDEVAVRVVREEREEERHAFRSIDAQGFPLLSGFLSTVFCFRQR
jgi:hypothetical protein